MTKSRIVVGLVLLVATVGLWPVGFPKTTPGERAAIETAMSKPRSELIDSCKRGSEIECRALLRTGSPFSELRYTLPLLCALMLGGWMAFIRGKSQAALLWPYATVSARAASVVAESCTAIVLLNLVKIALPSAWRAYAFVPNWLVFVSYTIAAHALWGQNIGKFIAGIKIVRADGTAIGWKEALIRSAVDCALGVAWVCIQVATMSRLSLDAVPEHARTTLVMASQPAVWSWFESLSMAWVLSEIAVALLNRQRRAIHDYFAGTVVLVASKWTVQQS